MKRSAHRRGSRSTTRHGAPQLRLGTLGARELVVDLFAGGGGTSEGMRAAMGRDADIAINHDPLALAMHEANHPLTKHYCESVFRVRPLDVCCGRPVGLLWLSPDCTHFSKSKGGKPRSKKIRGLAWVAVRWARDVRPRIIMLENVEEFADWGPLGDDDLPDRARAGKTFRAFVRKLEGYGYRVEHRLLMAADFGVPQTRKRLYLIARRDGEAITWPEPTHSKTGRGARRWRAAAEVIDWSLPVRSIFGRKKDLAEPTMRRIAVGIWRYVIDSAHPFIVPVTHPRDRRVHGINEPMRTVTAANRGEFALVAPTFVRTDMQSDGRLRGVGDPSDPLRTITSAGGHALVVPTLITTGRGERQDQAPRVPGLEKPIGTVVAHGQNHGLVAAFLTKHYGSPPDRMKAVGVGLDEPTGTITAQDHHAVSAAFLAKYHGGERGDGRVASRGAPLATVDTARRFAEVRAFLIKYNRTGGPHSLDAPVDTITAKARFGLVTIAGVDYQIVDIGMRMLSPRELFRAQSFRDDYVIAPVCDQVTPTGRRWRGPLIKTEQIAKAGNANPPKMAEVLVRANFRERERAAA